MVTRLKERMGGSPSINNRRISVFNLVTGLYHSPNWNEYLQTFEISREDAVDALNYCKETRCNENLELSFCEGCILDTIYEKNTDLRNIKWKPDENGHLISEDGSTYYLGTKQEFEDEIFGKPGWVIAEEILKRANS